MSWFIIALGAPFLWALVNIADKFLVSNYGTKEEGESSSPGSLVLFSSLIGLFASLGIFIFAKDVFSVGVFDRILLMFAGAFSILWIVLYLYSLQIEDVSAVVPWMLTIPVFGYILGFIFLGESLTNHQLLGGGIVVLGALILSLDFRKVKIVFKGRVAMLMLLSCIIYAINGIIFKFVASVDSFWISSFWEYLGLGIGGVAIFIFSSKYRKAFIYNIRESGMKIFSVNVISEWTTIAGNLLTNYALLIAPVAMVYIVGTFQPVAVLLFSFFSTKFFPRIVSEDFSKNVVIPKIASIIVMIFGSILLFT